MAIAGATDYFDAGGFFADLARRVAVPTESGVPERRGELAAYLEQEMVPAAGRLGATARVLDNPDAVGGPLLIAHRHEADDLPTVLTYGHADVVVAEPGRWRAGLDPWRVTVEGDRWYGRGTADNKAWCPGCARRPCPPRSARRCARSRPAAARTTRASTGTGASPGSARPSG
jgi:hypothetical protein